MNTKIAIEGAGSLSGLGGGGGGEDDSQLFGAWMLVVPLDGKNSRVWYHLGERRNFDICIQCGIF